MIKYINSLLKKNKESPNLDRKRENSVSFILDEHRRPVIELNFPFIESDEDIQKIAEILFLINSGYYKSQIIDMILELGNKEPDRIDYLKKILLYWREYSVAVVPNQPYDYNNKPCVSPLSFSKIVSQKNQ
jgi:hypothetical protein